MKNIKDNMYYKADKKIRRTWGISPVEKVVQSKKDYNRQDAKMETKELVNEELEDDDFDWWFNDPSDNAY